MGAINQVLKRAAWRLGVNNFLYALTLAAIAALALVMLLRLVQQAVVFTIDWRAVALWTPIGCLVIATAYAWFFRPTRKSVALTVDQGADLKESLSTALYVEKSEDAWARAAVSTAEHVARRVEMRRAVPIASPRAWPIVLALGLAFAVVYIAVPKLDWFSRKTKIAADEQKQTEVKLVQSQTQELKNKLEQMTQKLDLETSLEGLEAASKPGPTDPDAIRRSAIKNLSKLRDELSNKLNTESVLKMEATKKALEKLTPQGEQTADLAKSMASGDFSQMKQELEELKGKLKSGKMTQAELDQTAEQLKKLADQINKEAEKKSDLAKKLEKAGLDKSLANDPEAAKKALDAAENLTEKEKQDLKKQAEASKQSSESLQQMAEALQQMASECKNCNKPGGSKEGESSSQSGQQGSKQGEQSGEGQQGEQAGQESQGSEQMSGQLSEMEQIQAEMETAQAALSECNSSMSSMGEGEGKCSGMGEGLNYCQNQGDGGDGDYSQGDPQASQGRGRGGPGRASGGSAGESPADFSTNKRVDNKNQTSNGPIVASRLVEGEAVLNDSAVAFETAVTAADGEAADEVTNNVIPRDRQEAVKNYFGRLKKKAQDSAKKPPAPATKSETAKDADER